MSAQQRDRLRAALDAQPLAAEAVERARAFHDSAIVQRRLAEASVALEQDLDRQRGLRAAARIKAGRTGAAIKTPSRMADLQDSVRLAQCAESVLANELTDAEAALTEAVAEVHAARNAVVIAEAERLMESAKAGVDLWFKAARQLQGVLGIEHLISGPGKPPLPAGLKDAAHVSPRAPDPYSAGPHTAAWQAFAAQLLVDAEAMPPRITNP